VKIFIKFPVFIKVIRACFFRRTIPQCHLGVKGKETTTYVMSCCIAVLRLFMSLDWSEAGALMSLNLLEIDAIYA